MLKFDDTTTVIRRMQVECGEESERRDTFQDGNFDAGGVRCEVHDRFPAIEIGGTHDASPARQLRPLQCTILEHDTFLSGMLEYSTRI